jgi:hypothetical protein
MKLTTVIPRAVWTAWCNEQARIADRRQLCRFAGLLTEIAVLGATFATAAWLDRRTKGYRRPAIGCGSIMVIMVSWLVWIYNVV